MAIQTYLEDAKLDRVGATNALRVLPDSGKAFTEATIDKEFDFLYDGKTPLTRRFGAKCPQIICGNPYQALKVAKQHKNDIAFIVFDEADEIIFQEKEKSGQSQMSEAEVCKLIVKTCSKAQVTLFSATYKAAAKKMAKELAQSRGKRAPTFELLIEDKESNVESVAQCCFHVEDPTQKLKLLHKLIAEIEFGQIIIFAGQRHTIINTIVPYFENHPELPMAIRGMYGSPMEENERRQVEADFLDKKMQVLVCTDLLSRGWDPSGVGLVVQYDLPDHRNENRLETYQHRIGRTGRAGKAGVAMSFVTRKETALIAQLKDKFGRPIKELNEANYIDVIQEELAKIQKGS